MKETPYRVEGSWDQALRGVQRARPSAMLSGVVVPALLWLVAALYTGFSSTGLVRTGLPLPILAAVALASIVLSRFRSGRKTKDLTLTKLNALVNTIYIGLFLLTISGYFLIAALGTAATIEGLIGAIPGLILALYVLSAMAAVLWSPRSLPISKADDEMALSRSATWLPWLVGMQGFLVGLGVLLGTFASHDQGGWGALALSGLATSAPRSA